MKKLIYLCLAFILCFSLCACGNMHIKGIQAAIDPIARVYGVDMAVKKANGIYEFESDEFADLSAEKQLAFFEMVDSLEKFTYEDGSEEYIVVEFIDIYSQGTRYHVTFTDEFHFLNAGDQQIHSRRVAYDIPESNSGRVKCYWCNGTGSVKYNYGDSGLEAIIDGHEASWYGQCGSCGGTGYTD